MLIAATARGVRCCAVCRKGFLVSDDMGQWLDDLGLDDLGLAEHRGLFAFHRVDMDMQGFNGPMDAYHVTPFA